MVGSLLELSGCHRRCSGPSIISSQGTHCLISLVPLASVTHGVDDSLCLWPVVSVQPQQPWLTYATGQGCKTPSTETGHLFNLTCTRCHDSPAVLLPPEPLSAAIHRHLDCASEASGVSSSNSYHQKRAHPSACELENSASESAQGPLSTAAILN